MRHLELILLRLALLLLALRLLELHLPVVEVVVRVLDELLVEGEIVLVVSHREARIVRVYVLSI